MLCAGPSTATIAGSAFGMVVWMDIQFSFEVISFVTVRRYAKEANTAVEMAGPAGIRPCGPDYLVIGSRISAEGAFALSQLLGRGRLRAFCGANWPACRLCGHRNGKAMRPQSATPRRETSLVVATTAERRRIVFEVPRIVAGHSMLCPYGGVYGFGAGICVRVDIRFSLPDRNLLM
jgi:hypothetical protein